MLNELQKIKFMRNMLSKSGGDVSPCRIAPSGNM